MRVSIACDHAGIKAKSEVGEVLKRMGHLVVDFGAFKVGVPVDYPDYAQLVVHSLQDKRSDRGILICATGVGMCIAANRFSGIRAVVGTDEVICIAREHNDVNIVCFGTRTQSMDEIIRCLEAFLCVEYKEQTRHRRRINKLDMIAGL